MNATPIKQLVAAQRQFFASGGRWSSLSAGRASSR